MTEFIHQLLNPTSTIQSAGAIGGYIITAAIIFAECGLLVGFFLPGDSLLFTAGILAGQGLFNVWILMAILLTAAIVGVAVGYAVGAKWGRKLFDREDSRFFKRENLMKAEMFYEKHGGKTIILARFIPIIRTFVPVVAGIGRMSYPKLIVYNIIGGVVWVVGLVGGGFFLGERIPNIDTYLLPIIAIIILLSIAPGLMAMLKTPERRRSSWHTVKGFFRKQPPTA
jgi:membrane-associated protein